MFHFYFNDTIPSITDWIQAIGVFFVAGALYLQFTAYQKQQLQMRISLIPKFKIIPIVGDFPLRDDLIWVELKIILERNIAYNVKFIVDDIGNAKEVHTDKDISRSLTDGDHFCISASGDSELQPIYFFFTLTFEDILGNYYYQDFSFFADHIQSNAPKQINGKK